jgi:hypothetical protein
VKIHRVSEVRKDMRILKNIRKIEINLKFSARCSVQNAGCLKIKTKHIDEKKQSQYLYYRKEGNKEIL